MEIVTIILGGDKIRQAIRTEHPEISRKTSLKVNRAEKFSLGRTAYLSMRTGFHDIDGPQFICKWKAVVNACHSKITLRPWGALTETV